MLREFIFATFAACCSVAAHADTLQKIKDTGRVTLGVRESSGVLSYTTGDKYVGFHVELCLRALADIQKQLGLPKLEIKYLSVTSANRMALVQNGTIDMECGSTTNNSVRQKEVSFALTTYVEEIRIAVKSNSDINSITQLSGRKVVTTTGTTSVQLLRRHERANGVDFQETFAKDHAESMLMLGSNRADAFVMDAQVLAGNIAQSLRPADFKIVGETLGVEPIAIMMRKDDAALKQSVDNTLRGLMVSREIAQIYDKWFMKPIPPTGAVLNLPPSKATLAAWASPNTRPAEEYSVR